METEGVDEGEEVEEEESDDSMDSELEFDGGKWKTYIEDSLKNKEPFDIWLSKYTPTTVTKKDRFAWICVRSKFRDPYNSDVDGLMESWEAFLSSGRPVNYTNLKELACNHQVLSGKWLFFSDSGGKVDHLWSVVAKNIVNDGKSLPCFTAKVSAYEETNRHVVCIYNPDFTNREQLLQAEQAIRNMGLKCELMYKPDVYTYLGVYRNNPWRLSPIIMKSVFDIKTGKSVIDFFVPE